MRWRAMLIVLAGLGGCHAAAPPHEAACRSPAMLTAEPGTRDGMRWIPAGRYTIGARAQRPEEGPAHRVELKGFWIDQTEVTNAQFAAFVHATGYRTLAELSPDPKLYPGVPKAALVPSSLVFTGLAPGEGPAGPGSW
ncbi:MAG: formylglycine-generating enzyme family protein, partial [Novosphingobium sp.]|nr:formylglycine-generating enzyme family protein [Novosphingobium sp.]